MNLSVGGDQAINLEDIINEIGGNFATSLKNSLEPIVDRANSIERNYRAISESLRKMPEFRDLVSENEELKKELIEFRSSYAECPGVTLEVTEKAGGHEDTNAIVEQVYTDADLPPYGATTGSLLSSNGLYGVGDEDVHSFMNEEKATEFVEKHFEALNKHKNAAWIILKEPISKDEDPEPLNVRFKNE